METSDIIIKYAAGQAPENLYAIKVLNILDFFKGDRLNIIPAYQRPYSWGVKEVNDLIQDVKSGIQNEKKWFVGPIFSTALSVSDDSFEILDGQQRLTTIVLILRAIHTITYSQDPELIGTHPWTVESGNDSSEVKRENHLRQLENIRETIFHCLLKKELNKETFENYFIPRFQTSQATREQLNEFVIAIGDINNMSDYDRLKSVKAGPRDKYLPTLKALNENITRIYDWLEEEIKSEDGLYKVVQYATYVLKNLIFIEIPLQSKTDVLDIFETLNNRGKKLKLADILRFKSLKNANADESDELEKLWSDIFYYSGLLSSNKFGFFKDLDSFLERFINSISGDGSSNGYTDDSSRIKRFEEKYKGAISQGVRDIKLTLENWWFLFSDDDGWSSFHGESERIESLKSVLKVSLKYAENAQIAFIGYLCNQVSQEIIIKGDPNHDGTPKKLVEFVKTIFSLAIFHSVKSNKQRTLFITISKHFWRNSSGDLLYHNFSNAGDSTELKNYLIKKNNNAGLQRILFAPNSDSDTAKLILLFYELMKGGILPKSNRYKNNNLDHIIPKQWYENRGWKQFITLDGLKSSIENLEDSRVKELIQWYAEDEDFYSESKYASTFVQLIGNKFLILSTTNIRKANNFWLTGEEYGNNTNGGAREYLQKQFLNHANENFCIPTFPKPPFTYEMFDLTIMLERSVSIVDSIVDEFESFVFTANG